MNILAIGAHPDDIELGCGGTLLKARRAGHNVFLYVITRGDASGDPQVRTKELQNTADYIGAQKLWVDSFGDAKVQMSSELINHIEYFVYKSSADLVLTHSLRDYHHDHRAIAEATTEATRFSQNVLAYEVPLTKEFTPQIYYDISDVIDEKVELIRMFHSQNAKQFMRSEAIRGLAQYRAFQARLAPHFHAVESYEIVKFCLNSQLGLMRRPEGKVATNPPKIDLSGVLEHSGQRITSTVTEKNNAGPQMLGGLLPAG